MYALWSLGPARHLAIPSNAVLRLGTDSSGDEGTLPMRQSFIRSALARTLKNLDSPHLANQHGVFRCGILIRYDLIDNNIKLITLTRTSTLAAKVL